MGEMTWEGRAGIERKGNEGMILVGEMHQRPKAKE